MASRTGIELLPHACRIVEVASRARLFGGSSPEAPRVRAFREIPYSAADPDALSADLRQGLKGLKRRASVAVWGLRCSHQVLLLPPAAPVDLEAVARREARTTPGSLPAPPLADAVVAGALRNGRRQTGYVAVSAEDLRARLQPLIDAGVKVESVATPAVARREARRAPGGLPAPPLADAVAAGALRDGRRETGYAAVSAEELRARLQPLIDAGVRIASITTPALAHASLVRQRRALLPDAVIAVLSVNAEATAITVVHGNVVLFARELPWGDRTDAPAGDHDGAARAVFASRVAAELRRSLVYVRQSRKVDVSRLLVCGDLFDLRSLTGPLVDELALDVETLDVGDDLDVSRLPEPSDNFRSRLGAWRTALALAADPAPQPGLSSEHARPAAISPALISRAAAAAVAGALIVAAGWGVLGYLSAGVTARQERMRRAIGVLEPELQRQDEERRRVAIAAAREAALAAFASQGPRLAKVLEAFSSATPPDIALSLIRAEPGVASWRLVVEGQAEGPDAAAAHATFTRFLKALEASPLLGRPSAPPALHAQTSDPSEAVEPQPIEAPPEGAVRPAQPVAVPRPAATGPSYIEVARDGRLYRIPLRRNTGNLEADQRAEETRRLQAAALARRAAALSASGAAASGAIGRQPASVLEFTLRYEVPK